MSRKKTTTEYRRNYTPEQIEAERQYRARRYAENLERFVAEAAEYRAKNADAMNAREREARRNETPEAREARLQKKRARYQANRESILAYAKEYRAKNLDSIKEKERAKSSDRKEYRAEYRRKNAEKQKSQRAIWKANNVERIRETNARWLQNNLDKHRVHQHNRRSRIRTAGGALSSDIVKRLFALQKGKCACCKSGLDDGHHIDHIVPIALGGPNTDDNVQLLCPACNLSKGAKHPVDFMQSRGMLL